MEMITHPSHPHQLTQDHIQIPYLCYGCKEVGIGSCYHCKSNKCSFYLHQECAASPFSISHPFSKSCKFFFLRKGSKRGRLCDACRRELKGFRYKCKCTFTKRNLHPQCAKYEEKYEVNGWILKLKKKITAKCLHCEEKGDVKGWGYVSSCGDHCFHVVCLWERLYDDWSKGLFAGLSSDASEMERFTIVKLLMKQKAHLQPEKKNSGGGKVSGGDVVSAISRVAAAALGSYSN